MKEQIEKRAIEEMAEDLMICHVEFGEDDDIRTDYDATATMLYRDKGYRKQSEGEWIKVMHGLDFKCSLCDEKADCFISGYEWDVDYAPPYCPNCGAKMKGGAE
jgi:rubrerythrin